MIALIQLAWSWLQSNGKLILYALFALALAWCVYSWRHAVADAAAAKTAADVAEAAVRTDAATIISLQAQQQAALDAVAKEHADESARQASSQTIIADLQKRIAGHELKDEPISAVERAYLLSLRLTAPHHSNPVHPAERAGGAADVRGGTSAPGDGSH